LKTIIINNNIKSFDLGDSSNTIAQIRQRLFISGDLSKDSKSALYDKELAAGILKYKVEAAIMHLLKFFLTISKT
jgi:hypothetical protein